jgi:flagellar M-ring protein FliF
MNDYSAVIRYASLMFLFLIVYLLMLRPIQKRALAPLKALPLNHVPAQLQPEATTFPESAASIAQRSLILKKQLTDFVLAEPETSTTAVRAWLREDAL